MKPCGWAASGLAEKSEKLEVDRAHVAQEPGGVREASHDLESSGTNGTEEENQK